MRSLLFLLAALAALALGVPAALADEGSGSANGITVTVALSDQAVAGEEFTVAESIANTNPTAKLVRVTQTLVGPGGTVFSIRYPLIIPAGKTLAFELTFRFPADIPTGEYSLTLTAGGASATAHTEVV
jgi:hypothetical protein